MEIDNETQSVVDYAFAEQEFLAIVSAIQRSGLQTKSIGDSVSADGQCDSLSLLYGDPADFVPNPVFTAGASDIFCGSGMTDGKSRTGTIQVRVTDKIKKPGAGMIIKLINYEVSGTRYLCDSMVITTKEISHSYMTTQVTLVKGLCKTPANTVKYDFDRVFYDYPNGEPAGTGAFMKVYGSSTGVNRHGATFSTVTLAPGLTKYATCAYISKGALEITPEGFEKRTIDFGSGSCDEEASFTVNENTVTFKLK